jgi:hypothetical protein
MMKQAIKLNDSIELCHRQITNSDREKVKSSGATPVTSRCQLSLPPLLILTIQFSDYPGACFVERRHHGSRA